MSKHQKAKSREIRDIMQADEFDKERPGEVTNRPCGISPDGLLPDGTPLYLKTRPNPACGSVQLSIYNSLWN